MPGAPLSLPEREEISLALIEDRSVPWAEIGRRTGSAHLRMPLLCSSHSSKSADGVAGPFGLPCSPFGTLAMSLGRTSRARAIPPAVVSDTCRIRPVIGSRPTNACTS